MSADNAVSPANSSSPPFPHDDEEREDSSGSSPSSGNLPLTPEDAALTNDNLDSEKESKIGPIRARSGSAISSKSSTSEPKEKRKRSRVTPEQLAHLERYFAMDRSPTAGRRKEISEALGMQERQTQIWFQNRRAKAKLQDGKKGGRNGVIDISPDMPPELSTGFDMSLHNLIHESEPVTIIPCTDLSVGTWKRIATTVSRHDLVAYVCEAKRCLTWFIHSAGYGFKMEIPFEIILETKFVNASPGTGLASFFLSQPPMFYLETISSSPVNGAPVRGWKQCSDWTEGMQATKVLRHDLVGSAVQLAHVLRNLNVNTGTSGVPLHPPSYRPSPATSTNGQTSILGFVEPGHGVLPSRGSHSYNYELARPHSGGSLHQPLASSSPRHLGNSVISTSPSPSLIPSGGYTRMSPLPGQNFSTASSYSDYPDDTQPQSQQEYRSSELDLASRENSYHRVSHPPHPAKRSSYDRDPSPPGTASHSSYSSPSPHLLPAPFHSSSNSYWQPPPTPPSMNTSPMLSGALPPLSQLDFTGSNMVQTMGFG